MENKSSGLCSAHKNGEDKTCKICYPSQDKELEEHEREEWGGWKFVSEMLDNPNEYGIYPTGKCYKQLYDFVVAQKAQAQASERSRLKKLVDDIEEPAEWNSHHFFAGFEFAKDRIKKALEEKV